MPRLRVNTPFWLARDSAPRRLRFATLTRDLDVDVAIIGSGITGAALAWRFADAGIRVALVEAARIGRGSTAASTALLMQEPDEGLIQLTKRYGRSRADRIWQLSLAATRDLVATSRRLRIKCDLVHQDSVYYSIEGHGARILRAEHRRRTAAGLEAEWLDGEAFACRPRAPAGARHLRRRPGDRSRRESAGDPASIAHSDTAAPYPRP